MIKMWKNLQKSLQDLGLKPIMVLGVLSEYLKNIIRRVKNDTRKPFPKCYFFDKYFLKMKKFILFLNYKI